MKKNYLVINTSREGYAPGQIRETMTVRDLMYFLEDFDEDTEIVLGFDNQYTFGGLDGSMFEEIFEEDEE